MAGGRFDLDAAAMERLLEEAREHKGESLWQDARRRLRRNRPAWYALLFLAVFAARPATVAAQRSPVLSDLDHALEAPQLDGGDGAALGHLGEDPDGPREVERAYWQLSGLDRAPPARPARGVRPVADGDLAGDRPPGRDPRPASSGARVPRSWWPSPRPSAPS